jgi:DNA-binding transcriptional ArsR family regulator
MTLECFYTLPNRIEEHRIFWRIKPRLKQNVDDVCQIIQPVDYLVNDPWEAAIAQYLFQQLWQHPKDELILTHWIAFLLRRCEIVAKRILPLLGNDRNLGFPDLFMMASLAVNDPAKFFNNFDESRVQLRCWYPTFIRFTDIKLKHLLLPELRRVTGNIMFGQSNLGLVARSSRTRVREALERSGYTNSQISQYLLAWQCFKEYSESINLSVNRFRYQDFQKIADRYNELKEEDLSSVSGSDIQTWLDNISEAIRRLSYPPHTSFWSHFYSHSDEGTNLLENIPFETSEDEEMDETVNAFRQAIARLLNGLQEIQEKQMLFLKYGLELNQGQVARELGGKNQSTISRHIQKLNKHILLEIWQWVRKELKIEPSFTGLAEIQAVLSQHYSEEIDRFVQNSILSLDEQSSGLLKLFYVVKKPLSDMGKMMQKTEKEVRDRLNAIQQQLYSDALAQIQAEFNLNLQPQGAAIQSIPTIVETRLETILQLYAR